jgi:hypothetical protein
MSKINGKKVSKKNQLHDIVDWNPDNLIFADPEPGTVPGSDPPISFFRVNLLTQNHKLDENGHIEKDSEGNTLNTDTISDPLFLFDKCFSFGVSESVSPETKVVTGHQLSMSLWSREGAQEREIITVRKLETIVQKCKDHLISIRKEIKKPKLDIIELKPLDKILWWKEDENGDRVSGQGPTFSPKLIEFAARKDNKTGVEKPFQMCTVFYLEDEVDENGNSVEVSPFDFLTTKNSKKYCFVRPVVKIESIFFGAKIAIQCKVTESDIAPVQMGPQRLLHGRHNIHVNNKININLSKSNPLLSSSSKEEIKDGEETKQTSEETSSVSQELSDDTSSQAKSIKKKSIKKTKELE